MFIYCYFSSSLQCSGFQFNLFVTMYLFLNYVDIVILVFSVFR